MMRSLSSLLEELSLRSEQERQPSKGNLVHFEDLPLSVHPKKLIKILTNLGRAGVSIKLDGSPTIFCGRDPADNRFFVSKKGILNDDPKVYKSKQDIVADNRGKQDLILKLVYAFKYLQALSMREGIIQGDLLYTRRDVKEMEIQGQRMLTFQTNTILYAVPEMSDIVRRVKQSHMGISFHTTYAGRSLGELRVTNHNPYSYIDPNPMVWAPSPFLDSTIQVDSSVKSDLEQIIHQVKSSAQFLAEISQSDLGRGLIEFENSRVGSGHVTRNFNKYNMEVKQFLAQRYPQASSLDDQKLLSLFELRKFMTDLKKEITTNLKDAPNEFHHVKTFVKNSGGQLVETEHEGYVCSLRGTQPFKMVDRTKFSKNNFEKHKTNQGWSDDQFQAA